MWLWSQPDPVIPRDEFHILKEDWVPTESCDHKWASELLQAHEGSGWGRFLPSGVPAGEQDSCCWWKRLFILSDVSVLRFLSGGSFTRVPSVLLFQFITCGPAAVTFHWELRLLTSEQSFLWQPLLSVVQAWVPVVSLLLHCLTFFSGWRHGSAHSCICGGWKGLTRLEGNWAIVLSAIPGQMLKPTFLVTPWSLEASHQFSLCQLLLDCPVDSSVQAALWSQVSGLAPCRLETCLHSLPPQTWRGQAISNGVNSPCSAVSKVS